MKQLNSLLSKALMFTAAVILSTVFSTPAYAGSPPATEAPPTTTDATEQSKTVPSANTSEQSSVTLPKQESLSDSSKPAMPLTPDGQLTLVDDLSGSSAEGKQFITVITKAGNYFYIVIDRTTNSENVHFLNLVDENDLLTLLKDEKPVQATPAIPEPAQSAPVAPAPEVEPEPKNNSLPLILGIVLLLALASGGAFFYLKVLKPKQTGRVSLVPTELVGLGLDDTDDFDDLFDDDLDITAPDNQTEPYSYADYEDTGDEDDEGDTEDTEDTGDEA